MGQGVSLRMAGADRMCKKLRSPTFALLGFTVGMLLMYVALVGKVRRLNDAVHLQTLLDDTAASDVRQVVLGTFTDTQIGLRHCNGTNSSLCVDNPSVTTVRPSWDFVQKLRHDLVSETCSTWGMTSSPSLAESRATLDDNHNIIVDSQHHVMYCAIPKAACSSWRVAIASLTDNFHYGDPESMSKVHLHTFMAKLGLPSPSLVSDSELQTALHNYTKLLVVRHPFERLVSAYRDKFRTYNKWTKHFQLKYGRKIVLLYRGDDVTVESLTQGHDVTFEEFLTFISDESIPFQERNNPHWDTYQHLCHPCHVNYDHVIKFETLNVDNDVVLRRFFAVKSVRDFFPKRNMKTVSSKDLMTDMYKPVPQTLIRRIYNLFKLDMDMFGYDLPESIMES